MTSENEPHLVQSVLLEGELKELKKKTKAMSTKTAIRLAVKHYLECDRV